MKFSLKLIAGAAALLVAGAASAGTAIVVGGTTTGSDLVLTVWDNTLSTASGTGAAITIDTGLNYSTFGVGSAAATQNSAGNLLTTAESNLINSVFGTDANVSWEITANIDKQGTAKLPGLIYSSSTTSTPTPNNSGIVTTSAVLDSYFGAVNTLGGSPYELLGAGTGTTNDNGGFTIGTDFPADVANASASGFGNQNVYFSKSSAKTGTGATTSEYAGDASIGGFSYFTLTSAGALTYTYTALSAVPIPAALWLMGSGIVGLLGVGRRRSGAAVA
jgi:hypothetical protein